VNQYSKRPGFTGLSFSRSGPRYGAAVPTPKFDYAGYRPVHGAMYGCFKHPAREPVLHLDPGQQYSGVSLVRGRATARPSQRPKTMRPEFLPFGAALRRGFFRSGPRYGAAVPIPKNDYAGYCPLLTSLRDHACRTQFVSSRLCQTSGYPISDSIASLSAISDSKCDFAFSLDITSSTRISPLE